jgi:hypothetical protein
MQATASTYTTFVKGKARIESSVADSGYSLLSNLVFQGYSVHLPVAVEIVKLFYKAS